eukprot:TRINITY_DN1252_c0_g1_i4.p2 TRINITY_DN1252_c0_g1~~TRINITY_DN1252_c0_g1_i4.p2  ORF type:complete len:161 (+),score=48.06 TRINITY_DN1252_c0_g1_i4:63-545(+)
MKLVLSLLLLAAVPANGVLFLRARSVSFNASNSSNSTEPAVPPKEAHHTSYYDRVEAKTNVAIVKAEQALSEANHVAAKAEMHVANATGKMATSGNASEGNATNEWTEAVNKTSAAVKKAAGKVKAAKADHKEAKAAHRWNVLLPGQRGGAVHTGQVPRC